MYASTGSVARILTCMNGGSKVCFDNGVPAGGDGRRRVKEEDVEGEG